MTDDIKVYCLDGQVRDFAWAQQRYGIQLERAEPNAEGKVYRVLAYREKGGDCGGFPEVYWGDPKPYSGIFVAAHWPDAPYPPEGGAWPAPVPNELDWEKNYVVGRTDANGITGFGWGGGNAHGEGEGGAYSFWVRSDTIPSDCARRHGWMAGTFHEALHPMFYLVEDGGGPGPQPEPKEAKFVVVDSVFQPTEGTNVLAIDLINHDEDEPDFYDTRLDIRIRFAQEPGPPWDFDEFPPFDPYSMEEYIVELPYEPGPTETTRQFWWMIRHAGTEEPLSDWHMAEWERDKYGINRFAVEWGAEEEPGNGDEPDDGNGEEPEPGDNLAEIFLEMSDLFVELGHTCYRIAVLFGGVG